MKSQAKRLQWMAIVGMVLAMSSRAALGQLGVDEQHSMQFSAPGSLSGFQRATTPVPVTVASPDAQQFEYFLSLDEAIRTALQHSEVVRVLTGLSASSSGRTIYDTAIATTAIDQAVGRFDPVFSANSSFRQNNSPVAIPDPLDPFGARIGASTSDGTDLSAALRKTNRLGGLGEFRAADSWNQFGPGLPGAGRLDPTHRPSLEISYTQPLLAGFGRSANEAPIVIANLQQEQSFFQFKGSIQELVRGVIFAYWSLVQARTELWAREKQVEQSEQAFERVNAQFRAGFRNQADVSQSKVALANFKANLISAQATMIQREAALRNLLGLPPEDGRRLVPSTPPTRDRVEFRWEELSRTAQMQRPDLVELNLILLADQQRLIQSKNTAQPTLNAVALQRWNGLSGRALNGSTVSAQTDDHSDWTLGVTFSVPLGLRQARAQLRSQELVLMRDRANIQQSLHQIEHLLATSIRNIDQNFLQYEAFRETRQAARENLEVQAAGERAGRIIFLNVLQAITDWGNAVSSEAQALTAYNSELANLETQTGTILETHGVSFVQERFGSVSAWGRHFEDDCYPLDLKPTNNAQRYEDSGEAAEQAFDLEDYPRRRDDIPRLRLPQNPPEESASDYESDPPPQAPASNAPGLSEPATNQPETSLDQPAERRSLFKLSSWKKMRHRN